MKFVQSGSVIINRFPGNKIFSSFQKTPVTKGTGVFLYRYAFEVYKMTFIIIFLYVLQFSYFIAHSIKPKLYLMPSQVKKSFEAVANVNRRYEIKTKSGSKIASYNPLSQQIHFSNNGNTSFAITELKEMPIRDRRVLDLNEDEILSIYELIKDLPIIENKTRPVYQESKEIERQELQEEKSLSPVKMEHTVGRNIEKPIVLSGNYNSPVVNDKYTEPQVGVTYNNIKGKNILFIQFSFKVNGKFVPIKIPGNDINQVKDLDERLNKMKEMKTEISNKLSSGWSPVDEKI